MSSNLPPTITVCVDPLDTTSTHRPFGHHPAFSIVGSYISLLLTSIVASFAGAGAWITVPINMLALTVPAFIAIYCYCKPLTILRTNQKWLNAFLSGLRLELGKGAELVNTAEVLIALRNGESFKAEIYANGYYKTYDVAVTGSEVVLFNMAGIDREWALLNSRSEY